MDFVPTAANTTGETAPLEGDFCGIVGQSAAMRALYEEIEVVAPSKLPVLIWGASGTGKEGVARAIHRLSPRRERPFIPVNCSALQEDTAESVLFGHERGAFTGANEAHRGLFAAAHQGTLFLDELGELHAAIQAKLLRAIESGEVMRLGSNQVEHFDVRIVAATNVDLEQAVKERRFRRDLLERVRGAELELLPLAQRRDDLPRLARHLLARTGAEGARVMLTAEALAALDRHPFTGNVRELDRILRRALLRAAKTGAITAADLRLSPKVARPPAEPSAVDSARYVDTLGKSLDEIQKAAVQAVMAQCGGNRTAAAKQLGLSRTTLLRWDF